MSDEARSPAEILFGNPSPAPAPSQPGTVLGGVATKAETDNHSTNSDSPPKADSERAAALYDNVERGPYAEPLRAGLEKLADRFGFTEQQVGDMRREAAAIAHEIEIDGNAAAHLYDLYAHHVAELPADEVVLDWAERTRAQLRERYGDEAQARLQRAHEYVAGNEKLYQMLDATGLGSHPDVVLALAERAWRLPRGRSKS